jgi:hypothetical protein
MSNKQVYGVTVTDPETNAFIHIFASQYAIKPTTAVLRIIELFSVTNIREREKLAKRLHWKRHRNRGYRKLTSFVSKQALETQVLPSPTPQASNQTAKN